MTDTPKYPQIVVRYEETGEIGDGIVILGKCIKEMMQLGITEKERKTFTRKATSKDYEGFKDEVRKWVHLELTG